MFQGLYSLFLDYSYPSKELFVKLNEEVTEWRKNVEQWTNDVDCLNAYAYRSVLGGHTGFNAVSRIQRFADTYKGWCDKEGCAAKELKRTIPGRVWKAWKTFPEFIDSNGYLSMEEGWEHTFQQMTRYDRDLLDMFDKRLTNEG